MLLTAATGCSRVRTEVSSGCAETRTASAVQAQLTDEAHVVFLLANREVF